MSELWVELEVNNRKVARKTQAHSRLLDFLRNDLNLTGTKEGCGAANAAPIRFLSTASW